MIDYIKKKLVRSYQAYVYWSPIPVLSQGEVYCFNTFMLALVTFSLYWSMVVLPPLTKTSVENLYYYITGNSLSFKVIVSLVFTKEIHTYWPWIWSLISTKADPNPNPMSTNDQLVSSNKNQTLVDRSGFNLKKLVTLIK